MWGELQAAIVNKLEIELLSHTKSLMNTFSDDHNSTAEMDCCKHMFFLFSFFFFWGVRLVLKPLKKLMHCVNDNSAAHHHLHNRAEMVSRLMLLIAVVFGGSVLRVGGGVWERLHSVCEMKSISAEPVWYDSVRKCFSVRAISKKDKFLSETTSLSLSYFSLLTLQLMS